MEQLSEPMFLATTALPAFWDKRQELLFLGPWCLRADRRPDWEGLRAEVLPSPWDDRERFHAAAEYLDRRMEEVLPPLADCLNAQLGRSGSPRYWRILIGTWLMHSLHVAYDRYAHLMAAFEKHPDLKTLLLEPACFQTPTDTLQAVDWMMTDDPYNLQIFSQLLGGMGCSFPARALAQTPSAGNGSSPAASLKRGLRNALRGAESALFKTVSRRPETALVDMYCPSSVLRALAWASGFKTIPSAFPERERPKTGEPAALLLRDGRRSALAALPTADEFMRLWVRSLPENFPTLYLEGFQAARERALQRLRRAPRTFVSATGWHYSEPLKFFAAELSERGGRLVAVQHGGGYGLFRSMPMEEHERRISDSFLGWDRVPSLQLVGLRKPPRVLPPRRLLYVTTTNPRYPFRFYSAPQAHQLEEYFEWQVRFLEGLEPPVRSRTAVRLHPLDFGHCRRRRLGERFGGLRWDRTRSFAGAAARSRLLVVDHPGTPLLTALAGNFPTLLFWNPRLWELRAEAQSYLELLRQAGLFYEEPEAAAEAVQKILLEGPLRWWSRSPVQEARRRFVERYAPVTGDWLRIWSERLRGGPRKVLVGATCAGGANVLLPVLRKLQARPGVRLRVIAERQALQILLERGIPTETTPSGNGEREAFLRSLFRDDPPDALLLGTSWGDSIEKDLLRIGRESGVPSLSVVDHWANYRERFLEPGSRQLRLPNRIALMDSHALEGAVADGLPREILNVTGQPHLQSLAAALDDPALRRRAGELRAHWLRGAEGPLVLFCSELFSDDRGYTETDALEGLAQALDLLEAGCPVRPKLVVKLHPKEPAGRFHPGPRAARRGFEVAQAEPAWGCLLAADALVGMTSMLLVEGAIAGRPAISYQPEQGMSVPFVGSQMRIIRAARSVQDLAAGLSDSLSPAGSRDRAILKSEFLDRILSGDAAGRIADLLLEKNP